MTIYDIAKLANVSKSTVSRVLNQEKGVSQKSKIAVEKVIEQTGFIPNNSAVSLNKTRRKKVLVLMTRLDSYAENRALRGMISAAGESIEFMIYESNFNIALSQQIILDNKFVDGYVIFAISGQSYDFVNKYNKNVVFVGQKIADQKSVYYDDFEGMTKLITAKCQASDVLYVGLEIHDKTSGYYRKQAVVEYCQKSNTNVDFLITDFESKTVYDKLKNCEIAKFKQIFCATDKIAIGVYKFCLKHNLKIEIFGFGDNKNLNFLIDNFVTVNLGYKKSGEKIIDILNNDEKVQFCLESVVVEY